MTREGYLVAVPSRRRGARRVVAVIVAIFAVIAIVVTVFLAAAARDPERVSTQPSLTAPSVTPAPAPVEVNRSLSSVVGDQTLRLELPEQAARGLVVYFPDAGADAAAWLAAEQALALKTAGWALATTEFHGASWGSPTSSDDVKALLDWAGGQVTVSPLLLVSEGMGATTSLEAMSRSAATGVSCWFAVEPRTDLYTIARADPAIEEEIVAAWGRVPSTDELPLAITASLPTDTVYRVGEVAGDASSLVREDAAELTRALASSGLDADTLPVDGRQAAVLVEVAEGCTA